MIKLKKRAFSLIEILQTVILVGIIAGLSVSFFKKVNNDDKLMMSTAKMVNAAIEEANLQMCSDETPSCMIAGERRLVENPNNECINFYPGSHYDKSLGFCVISNPAAIPTFQNPGNYINPGCTASFTENPTTHEWECLNADGFHVHKIEDYKMQLHGNVGGVAQYYAKIPCVDTATNIYYGTAQALHEFTCTGNIPQWSARITRNIEPLAGGQIPNDSSGGYPISEICYRLWDIINHKPQTLTDGGGNTLPDLFATCVEFNRCINTQDCDTAIGVSTNKANMVLPNGARLYNLSCVANTDCHDGGAVLGANFQDYQHIFIKADRVPDDRTFKFDTSSTGFINAVKWYDNNIWDKATNVFVDANFNKSTKVGNPLTNIDDKYSGANGKVTIMKLWLGLEAPAPPSP